MRGCVPEEPRDRTFGEAWDEQGVARHFTEEHVRLGDRAAGGTTTADDEPARLTQSRRGTGRTTLRALRLCVI